jgi:flagellar hook-length control protein FliK
VMASVPNTRIGLAPPVPGAPAPVAVEGAEFASLLVPAAPVTLPEIQAILPDAGEESVDGEVSPAVEATDNAPSDAAQLAALIPVAPAPVQVPAPVPSPKAGETKPETAQAPIEAASAPALPKASAKAIPPTPQEQPPVPTQDGSATKAPTPQVAAAPSPSPEKQSVEATPEKKAKELPLPDETLEAAKRIVEQALRPDGAVQTAKGRAPRPQNGPATREIETIASAIPAPASPAPSIPVATQVTQVPVAASAEVTPSQPARPVDQTVERELDLARDSEWLDRLARDIARTAEGETPMRFRLHPQTLGHLRVELSQGDHGTSVRLTVETEAARQILADAQPRLAAEARAQGVRIAETHVDLSGSGEQRRQDETQQAPLIRTVREAAPGAAAPAQPDRSRSDRYA